VRRTLEWLLVLASVVGASARPVRAQAPTIPHAMSTDPGSTNSLLGVAPGSGADVLGDAPGAGAMILSGRAGVSTPRVPTTVASPSGTASPTASQRAIRPPAPLRPPAPGIYGSLSLPAVIDYEGPPHGLTLDMAIDRLLHANLELRSKFYEIPQAQADILNAGLRANPIFYADGQLVPYGAYTRQRPGGQTQYDVNISYPLDLSHKRQARILVATRAHRVLEAQYQDAVRGTIDNLYLAFVDVLAARQTVIYSRTSVAGFQEVLAVTQVLYEKDTKFRADVARVQLQYDAARLGLLDAESAYRRARLVLAGLLSLPPGEAETLEVRGTIRDRASPPPPEDELRRIALTARPDLVAYRLGIGRAEADVRLALANRFSDIYVLYQPYTLQNNQPLGLKSPTSWALGLTAALPVYNRNQGGILRARLNVDQTRIELAGRELQAINEVQQAIREYDTTRAMVRRIETELEPNARRMLADTRELYIAGEVNVVAFLITQRDYNDIVKLDLDATVRHRRSMLGLNTVVGQRIMP
jgi:cobalt-zinc-cadmium efflux system outer membrane protein